MSDATESPSREQQLFWRELFLLCVDARYIGAYRDHLGRRVKVIATIQVIAANATIAAWLGRPDPPWKWIWASILAAVQIVKALEDVYPWSKQRHALGIWSRTLNRLFVQAQKNWDDICCGKCTNAQIRRMLHQVRTRKQRAEDRFNPNGLSRNKSLFDSAEREALQSFEAMYNMPEQ